MLLLFARPGRVAATFLCAFLTTAHARGGEQLVPLPTGVTVRCVESGDPAGEAVLFLHGFTDTLRSWEGTLAHLRALRPDLRLVAFDLRGHGGSTLPDGEACRAAPEACFDVPGLAADALALLDALRIERAHVVGHSLGSLIAQELALAHPDRVRRLVLVGSGARLTGSPFLAYVRDELTRPWRAALESRGLEWPRDAWDLTPLDADPGAERWLLERWVVEPLADPALLTSIAADAARIPLGTWIGVVRALEPLDQHERLAGLRAPTLVLWGVRDDAFPAADQDELRAALDAASERHGTRWFWKPLGRADAAGPDELAHNPQWAAAEAVARDLAAFLREGGAPTDDLPHADPTAPHRVRITPGAAGVVAR